MQMLGNVFLWTDLFYPTSKWARISKADRIIFSKQSICQKKSHPRDSSYSCLIQWVALTEKNGLVGRVKKTQEILLLSSCGSRYFLGYWDLSFSSGDFELSFWTNFWTTWSSAWSRGLQFCPWNYLCYPFQQAILWYYDSVILFWIRCFYFLFFMFFWFVFSLPNVSYSEIYENSGCSIQVCLL